MSWQTMLLELGATINPIGFVEHPTMNTTISTESQLLCPLANKGTVMISGPDASKFLQGQVTCDINALISTPELSMLGAHCTHQGRMRFSFRAIAQTNDKILLTLPKSMIETAISSLKKYSVFSKIDEIVDVSHEYFWLGLKGNIEPGFANGIIGKTHSDNGVAANEHSLLVQLSNNSFELCLFKPSTLKALWQTSTQWQPINETYWDYQTICLGLGMVTPNTIESFIPQMLNLQAIGNGISFTKGCYTGQEVVARMAYLGKLKKRVHRFNTTGNLPYPGDTITNSAGKNIGEVVIAAPDYYQLAEYSLLAVVNSDQAEQTLSISGHLEQKLRLLELPYAIPIKGHP